MRSAGIPRIAVITPTKNRRVLLAETMDSVVAQTLSDWEHIIVDDGSDDGTDREVQSRAQEDPRVRYWLRAGRETGASACRNEGLRAAEADLVVFLDSDDLLDRECLEQRVTVMNRNQDLDFVVFRTGVFEKTPGDLGVPWNPDLIGDDLLSFLFFDAPWQTAAPTWRRAAMDRLGGFDETLPSWQDIDLHVRAIASGLRYLRFDAVDHHMRWQDQPDKISLQQHRSPHHLKAAQALFEKFEAIIRGGPGMNWMRQRALCSLYFFVAERWVAIGGITEGLACWRQAYERKLTPGALHATGAALLMMQSTNWPGYRLGQRISHKWKGFARLRLNAELVSP